MLHQILAMLINTQPDFTDPLNLTISIYTDGQVYTP